MLDNNDIKEVIENLASKKTYISEIVTHHYKLDQINEALEMAADKSKAIKVIIDME